MKKILCTCPPMIRQIDSLESVFARRKAEVVCPKFDQVLSREELLELVPGFDGWIIGDDPATEEVFRTGRAGRLRAAVKWGAGVDNVDFEGARHAGIPVTNTPGTFGEAVSDVAIGYLYGLGRHLFAINGGVQTGHWPKPTGMLLTGKTVALVGLGHIGRAIARKLHALGLKVLGYDPYAAPDATPGLVRLEWPQRLEEAHFLILACALTADNRHLVGSTIFAQMRPGSFLINVGRGPLVDERALFHALRSGTLAGAALEVMETEPLPADSPLRQLPNVVFGSHNSSNALEAVLATSHEAIDKLFRFLEREESS